LKRFTASTALGLLVAFAGLWALWLTAPDVGEGVRLFLEGLTFNQKAQYVFALVIIGPVFEESIYRGQFFTILRGRHDLVTGVLGSTLLFAIMHGLAPVAFVQGVLLALVYEYSRSLWGSVLVHIANNAIWYMVFVY
ncbi:MAG: CPBP family intramembrane metalloprotease, partial [Thermodesulfovibrionales bacterium]|nr:CPBP family intramembrane metalloprotease [Thermodesulfovibrionales bacterium]